MHSKQVTNHPLLGNMERGNKKKKVFFDILEYRK
nr:MAG TPA: hypothetical protein [Caudoviricetes sp.]